MTGVYDTRLNGIVKLSKSQYDAMETHDAGTKYIVVDGNSVKEYLGTIPIGATEGSGTDIRGTVSVFFGGNVCTVQAKTVGGYATTTPEVEGA